MKYNSGYRRMFQAHRLTLGLFFPLESYRGDIPDMQYQESLAREVEKFGFAAVWFRDVPLRDPSFGDTGQVFDPWVYLSWIAAHTFDIALATGSIVMPLRHPLHTAKAAASIEQLSNGRLVLGVASGDRPVEFPAFAIPAGDRAALFRQQIEVLEKALYQPFPQFKNSFGMLSGHADTLPKLARRLPLLTTGYSQQNIEWIAQHSDGWLSYPRPIAQQQRLIEQWRTTLQASTRSQPFKPFAQSLYIDLLTDPSAPLSPIHLGFRGGRSALLGFLEQLQQIGVNHVALNLKYGSRPASEVIQELAEEILPYFPSHRA